MTVDEDRQATARARRKKIIEELHRGFNPYDSDSPVGKFKGLTELGEPHWVVTNADIDGLVASQMLASVTSWRVHALTDRQGRIRVHPSHPDASSIVASGKAFGVDVFSPLFAGVSNHPILFKPDLKGTQKGKDILRSFDSEIESSMRDLGILNLSGWVGISSMGGSRRVDGIPYKYPLGSAQVMLAVLESVGLGPQMYDRQYMPWMIANCDGGLDTIRNYAWNAEPWWSALAASVGPASLSEAIYRLATEQRPNEFVDIDRRLRYDEPERSSALNTKWNLKNAEVDTLESVVGLIEDLTGWVDPFEGGVSNLKEWQVVNPTARALPLKGILTADRSMVQAHLSGARRAIHMNFSVFRDRGTALGWVLDKEDAQLEQAVEGETPVEEVVEDDPTIPDEE